MNGHLHKLITGLLTTAICALCGFLWNLNAEIATIRVHLETTNARTAEILAVLDELAPRTLR